MSIIYNLCSMIIIIFYICNEIPKTNRRPVASLRIINPSVIIILVAAGQEVEPQVLPHFAGGKRQTDIPDCAEQLVNKAGGRGDENKLLVGQVHIQSVPVQEPEGQQPRGSRQHR